MMTLPETKKSLVSMSPALREVPFASISSWLRKNLGLSHWLDASASCYLDSYLLTDADGDCTEVSLMLTVGAPVSPSLTFQLDAKYTMLRFPQESLVSSCPWCWPS